MHLEEVLFQTPTAAHWKKIGIHHRHGIDLPLSALHSDKSCGIGEFLDLIPLIDWIHPLGVTIIQLLPLNDSGDDPSPYFLESAFALNPLYLSLHALPHVEENRELEEKITLLRRFNKEPRIPYQDIQSNKFLFLQNYFATFGKRVVKTKGFEHYLQANPWIRSYALFKVIKLKMSKNPWISWPEELKYLSEERCDLLMKQYEEETLFYFFLQYLCYLQLTHVHAYANQKGILLKGDLPILVSQESADVWQYPEKFDLHFSAGSPPDLYSKEGQAWGLPIFKWEIMKKDHFDWWKQRLDYASHFFDLYRIDHVLGLFRLWTIPFGEPAKNGKFIPEDETLWLSRGREMLSFLLRESSMLPIAEDLGIVPKYIRQAITGLGIPRTIVLRWEKWWETHPEQFVAIDAFNPISMTTVSTHDSETLALWWNDFPEEAKQYAAQKGLPYTPHLEREKRVQLLWDSHHSASLFHINLLGEYLALFPELVSNNPIDERINIPGKVLSTNWTYKIRPSIEELVAHKPVAEKIHALISAKDPELLS